MVKRIFEFSDRQDDSDALVEYAYAFEEVEKLREALQQHDIMFSDYGVRFDFEQYGDVPKTQLGDFGLQEEQFNSCRLEGVLSASERNGRKKGSGLEIFISNDLIEVDKIGLTFDEDDIGVKINYRGLTGYVSSDSFTKEEFDLIEEVIRGCARRTEKRFSVGDRDSLQLEPAEVYTK